MVSIVDAFGIVAHSYLKYRDSKNGKVKNPHQACRIEPFDSPRLNREAQEIYNELLRYSVFIEDVRGRSRRGSVVLRLWLRRFLIPHFNLTFSSKDSVEVEPAHLERLLLDPQWFQKQFRMTSPYGLSDNPNLFDSQPEEVTDEADQED